MQPRLLIEGDLRPDKVPGVLEQLHEFPHVGWMVQVECILWNTRVRDDNWSAWGTLRAAEYLASRRPEVRAIKPMWWDAGWGTTAPPGESGKPWYTTDDRLFEAAQRAAFDATRVWHNSIRTLFSDLRAANALDGLFAYFEWERQPYVGGPDKGELMRRILADPMARRNLLAIGGLMPENPMDDQDVVLAASHETLSDGSGPWSDKSKSIRAVIARFTNRLAASCAWSYVRPYTRNWTPGGYMLSNVALAANVDGNGHASVPARDMFPGQVPCVYMHEGDDHAFENGKHAVAAFDRCSLEHAAMGAKLSPNISAGLPGEVIARRARINAIGGAPSIIFLGDPSSRGFDQQRIANVLEAARLTAPND